MIFNLGLAEPARHIRHEARRAGWKSAARSRNRSPPRVAGNWVKRDPSPHHARLADKFSVSARSCSITPAAAVHDTGHQMLQTGRLFTGGINTPHAGCVLSYLRGGQATPAHVILPKVWVPPGSSMPHGQDAGFLGKAQRSVRV